MWTRVVPGRGHVTDGLAVLNVFQLSVRTPLALAILAVLGAVVASVAVHPDYLADFNLQAMGKPDGAF